MENRWEILIDLITEMAAIYQQVLEAGRAKREALVKVNLVELNQITRQEDAFAIKIGGLDKRRSLLVRELGAEYSILAENLTLATLIPFAESSVAKRLDQAGYEFLSILQQVAEVNELNAKLLQQGLAFIQYNINLLSQTRIEPVYAAQGAPLQGQQSRNLIDSKA